MIVCEGNTLSKFDNNRVIIDQSKDDMGLWVCSVHGASGCCGCVQCMGSVGVVTGGSQWVVDLLDYLVMK